MRQHIKARIVPLSLTLFSTWLQAIMRNGFVFHSAIARWCLKLANQLNWRLFWRFLFNLAGTQKKKKIKSKDEQLKKKKSILIPNTSAMKFLCNLCGC